MNKAIKIAMDILAGYHYVYDPNHNDKPSGDWKRTNSGWSTTDDSKVSPPVHDTSPSTPEPEPESKPDEIKQEEEKPQKLDLSLDDANPADAEKPENEEEKENLFDDKGGQDEFVTDEKGKEEEQEETEEKPAEGETEKNPEESDELSLSEDDDAFDESKKDEYLDQDKYEEYIERMNLFIKEFDEGEGKENEVTFKAIASNLDWSSPDDVKAFQEHCQKKGIDGAADVLAFLYFQHKDNEENFDKILADMP